MEAKKIKLRWNTITLLFMTRMIDLPPSGAAEASDSSAK